MTTLLEPPPGLSVVPTAETAATAELTVAEMMVRAIALYESANNDLLDAGRLLASVQALGKKKFPKLMVEKGLEKTQAAKLIKMAEVADFIPSIMAGRLGIHMLIQLGQKRNEAALDAITDDDTQLSVAQKMKTLRAPAAPKENKPVRFIGNQKGGVGKLRIEVPGGPEAVEIERDWRESGLPPHQWLKKRLGSREQGAGGIVQMGIQPHPNENHLIEVGEKDPCSAPLHSRSQESFPPAPCLLLPASLLKSKIAPPNRTCNPALHNEVPLLMDIIEPSATETLAAIVTPQPDTALPYPATKQPTVYEVATAELHEYLEAQSQRIAPEPQQETSPFPSSTSHDFSFPPSPLPLA
ncbi:MAG: hypothetical protein PUP93_24790, partial [Rhizonema sp. NSF051]|nr:hypothetical protein [Rhizonema sp. NSF051]